MTLQDQCGGVRAHHSLPIRERFLGFYWNAGYCALFNITLIGLRVLPDS